MNSATEKHGDADLPEIDLRKVFKPDQELPPAGSHIVEAEIFRSRANSADNDIKELRDQIENLKAARQLNRDKWSEKLTSATDEMLQREGADPLEGNGELDYRINGMRVQVESLSEDSIEFTLYSSDSPLEPDQVRKAETLAETVERELCNERQKIEDRDSKIEAAEEYRSNVKELFDSRHVLREVVRELRESSIMKDLSRERVNGKHILYEVSAALSEAGHSYNMRETIEDFHRDSDLEPEECLAIVLDTLRSESEDSKDLILRPAADGGVPKNLGHERVSGEHVLEEIYDQLDVSKSDFQSYSPRELVSEITEGCNEIKQVIDDSWKDYDNPLKRGERFVESVEKYLESIGYKRDTLEGIPYERAEEILSMTK